MFLEVPIFYFLITLLSLSLLNANMIENQIQKDSNQLFREENKKVDLFKEKPKTTLKIQKIDNLLTKKTTVTCFNIYQTNLKHDLSLTPPKYMYEKLNNHCININDIQSLLVEINQFYQENNLITTRAYVPPQNLSSGILELVIKAGTLNGYAYLDGVSVDTRLLNAFAIDINSTIDLRELEQGVENFNRPDSQEGKMKLVPGKNQGESYLVMEQKQTKPWKMSLGVDNSGYETTGKYKGLIDFTYDNLFNSNDTTTLNLSTNLDDASHTKRAISGSFSYSVPYGKWLYTYSFSKHQYHRIIQGINQQYYVDGFSTSNVFGINRLLYRDKSAKVNFYGTMSFKKSKNFIENFEIETQRRKLTIFEAGILGSDTLKNTKLSYKLGVKVGSDLFSGMEDIPGIASSRTTTYLSKLNLQTPFNNQKFVLTNSIGLQYSDDELAGSEQFGVGGRCDVRGFHDDNLYGNSGIYLRNEMENAHQLNIGNMKSKFFIGFDIGAVKESATTSWSSRKLVGIATGVRYEITKYFKGDITLSRALKCPQEFESSKNQIYFSNSLVF